MKSEFLSHVATFWQRPEPICSAEIVEAFLKKTLAFFQNISNNPDINFHDIFAPLIALYEPQIDSKVCDRLLEEPQTIISDYAIKNGMPLKSVCLLLVFLNLAKVYSDTEEEILTTCVDWEGYFNLIHQLKSNKNITQAPSDFFQSMTQLLNEMVPSLDQIYHDIQVAHHSVETFLKPYFQALQKELLNPTCSFETLHYFLQNQSTPHFQWYSQKDMADFLMQEISTFSTQEHVSWHLLFQESSWLVKQDLLRWALVQYVQDLDMNRSARMRVIQILSSPCSMVYVLDDDTDLQKEYKDFIERYTPWGSENLPFCGSSKNSLEYYRYKMALHDQMAMLLSLDHGLLQYAITHDRHWAITNDLDKTLQNISWERLDSALKAIVGYRQKMAYKLLVINSELIAQHIDKKADRSQKWMDWIYTVLLSNVDDNITHDLKKSLTQRSNVYLNRLKTNSISTLSRIKEPCDSLEYCALKIQGSLITFLLRVQWNQSVYKAALLDRYQKPKWSFSDFMCFFSTIKNDDPEYFLILGGIAQHPFFFPFLFSYIESYDGESGRGYDHVFDWLVLQKNRSLLHAFTVEYLETCCQKNMITPFLQSLMQKPECIVKIASYAKKRRLYHSLIFAINNGAWDVRIDLLCHNVNSVEYSRVLDLLNILLAVFDTKSHLFSERRCLNKHEKNSLIQSIAQAVLSRPFFADPAFSDFILSHHDLFTSPLEKIFHTIQSSIDFHEREQELYEIAQNAKQKECVSSHFAKTILFTSECSAFRIFQKNKQYQLDEPIFAQTKSFFLQQACLSKDIEKNNSDLNHLRNLKNWQRKLQEIFPVKIYAETPKI